MTVPPVLHVVNGDVTADVLRRSTVAGDRVVFREALVTGPAPSGLSGDDWRALRAAHLAEESGLPRSEVEARLLEQERALAGSREYDEVVLWFEHDLFCLVNLLHLLDRFAGPGRGTARLTLVWIGHPRDGRPFHGLGSVAPEELEALAADRRPVTDRQLDVARAAWRAYGAADPTAVEDLLRRDLSCLPFLQEALLAHLARFPSARNGLGRVENFAVERIAAGVEDFRDLFREFGAAYPVYALGDVQFLRTLARLGRAHVPLLDTDPPGALERTADALTTRISGALETEAPIHLRLTEAGRDVLSGTRDFIDLNRIDLWLGGTHLRAGAPIWRWDEDGRRLTLDRRCRRPATKSMRPRPRFPTS